MPSESRKAVLSAPTRWLLPQAQLSLSLAPQELPAAALPIQWGQATCGQAACSFCSCWAPLPACWGSSLIVPSNVGEAAQPLHPTSLTSPCHAPKGAGAGLSQTCFRGPQHNTGFIRASPGALIWDTPQQPLMNPPHSCEGAEGWGVVTALPSVSSGSFFYAALKSLLACSCPRMKSQHEMPVTRVNSNETVNKI